VTVEYRRKDFLTAIDMDYNFAGARTASNTAEEVAQMKDMLITAVNAQIPTANIDAMFRRILELVARDANQFIIEQPAAPTAPEEGEEEQPQEEGEEQNEEA